MTCHEREQDLLLLIHGEMSPGRRLRLLAHLRRCRRCRQCREKLLDVSRLIAGAVRTPDMPPWVSDRNRRPLSRVRSQQALLLSFLVLLAGLLMYGKSTHRTHPHLLSGIYRAGNITGDPCR